MKKFFPISVILLFVFVIQCHAQIFIDKDGNIYDNGKPEKNGYHSNSVSEPEGFDKSKLSLGGSFGLQFGDYTLINISPQIGYDLSDHYTVGTGFGYSYYKDKVYDYGHRYDFKSSYLSFDIFARYYPIGGLVLSVQPEISRMWRSVDGGSSESKFVPSFLIGGGFRLGGMIAMIQYDVVQDKNTPYSDTIFYTVGYSFNF